MCGRYYIPEGNEFADISSLLDLVNKAYVGSPALARIKSGEVFPADVVPIVMQEAPKLMKWGFLGFNNKGIVINARLETAAEKPMFRKSFSAQRCLVPAGYYFEWQKDGAKKQKYAIMKTEPIYMAGLWQTSNTEPLPLFVILTRPATSELEFIHDRMPVILPKEAHFDWLCGRLSTKDLENIQSGHFICESVS